MKLLIPFAIGALSSAVAIITDRLCDRWGIGR